MVTESKLLPLDVVPLFLLLKMMFYGDLYRDGPAMDPSKPVTLGGLGPASPKSSKSMQSAPPAPSGPPTGKLPDHKNPHITCIFSGKHNEMGATAL